MLEKAEIYAEGLDHPECIAVHPDGSVWAGCEAGQIYRIDPDTKDVQEIANTGGFNLGLAFGPGAGWLAVCDLANHCVWRLDTASGKLSVLTRGTNDHNLIIPNYIVFDQQGNFYLSESGTPRKNEGMILKYDHNGEGVVWHRGPFNFANGLALWEDHLYIVSSFLPGVERVEILADGMAGERDVYCTLPRTVPDGLAFEAEGNLLVSCYSPNILFHIDRDRAVSTLIDDWDGHTLSNPTNIAFGGKNLDQLFTANLGRWHITKIDIGITGHPLVSHNTARK